MLKRLVKIIGRLFVILDDEHISIDPEEVRKILIIGSGTTSHLGAAIRDAITRFEPDKITVLTSGQREAFLQSEFPDVERIILYGRIGRFTFARAMLRDRKKNYDLIITMSLDIFVNMTALCFAGSLLTLYNEWHCSYLIRFRTLRDFVGLVKRIPVRPGRRVRSISRLLSLTFIGTSGLIYYLFAYMYLFTAVIFILLKRQYHVFKNRFSDRTTEDG